MKLKPTQTAAALSLATALALVSGVAVAQTNQNFVGPAIGVALTAQSIKTPLSSQNIPSLNGQVPQASEAGASLLGSWGFSLSEQWFTTLSLAWDLNPTGAGEFTYTSGGAQTGTLKSKEHMSLSVAPGYKVNQSMLVYGKLAYHQLKGEYSDTAATQKAYPDLTGMGIGLGLAFALTPKWEMRAEYESVKYNEKDVGNARAKPEQTLFSLGLLYKF